MRARVYCEDSLFPKVHRTLADLWWIYSKPVPADGRELWTLFLQCSCITAVIGGLFYNWMFASLEYSWHLSVAMAVSFSLLLLLTLLLVHPARCVFSMIMPTLGTKQGRKLLFSTCIMIAVVNITPNIMSNLKIILHLIKCICKNSSDSLLNSTALLEKGSWEFGDAIQENTYPIYKPMNGHFRFSLLQDRSLIYQKMHLAGEKIGREFLSVEVLVKDSIRVANRLAAGFLVLYLCFESTWYLKNYLTNLRFDNFYITKKLERLAADRKATHLLVGSSKKLIRPTGLKLSWEEVVLCLVKAMLVTVALLLLLLLVAMDHFAFSVADTAVRKAAQFSAVSITLSIKYKTKTGIALLYDEVSENAYDIRLKLTKEVLTIQKQDVVCVSGSDHSANHRTVTLRRQPVGGLGLSIKGGAEHKVPVVISKIFKDQAAEQTGMLFIGDAIIQVNGINVESATHEEVVHLLRNAGDEVTITVQYLREAPSFLKLPLGSPGPSSDHSSGTSSPLFDSGLHLNGNSTNTAPSSPSSPIANEPKYEKRWLDILSVPLSMARISRYKTGTDKLRSNAFEVLALDGVSTGILQFYTAQESADWLRAMSTNISDLTLQNMKMANKCCSPSDQVIHMGWVNERLEGTDSSQLYKFKFLALKGSSFYIFSTPPVSTLDWVRAEKIYNLCEVLFKIHKLWLADDCWLQANLYLGIHQDFDLEDQRPYCFSVMVGHGKSHYFNVELGSELAVWEKSFQRAIFLEVQRTGSKTYMCSWQGDTLCFTVDFALGFTCFDSKTKNVLWRFKFSQLKGSSDDGKTRVKLLFQNVDTKQIETKELEFQDLTSVLHCIHSFIAAKVASVDPVFIDSQSIARKYMYSN